MAEDQKDTVDEQKDQTEQKITMKCPCCRQEVSIEEFQTPVLEDQDNFLMSMLGGVPYERTYKYLRGHIGITVKAITPELSYRHVTISSALVRNFDKIPGIYSQVLMLTALLEQLFMVKSIDITTVDGNGNTHMDIEIPYELLDEIEYYQSKGPVEDDKFLKRICKELTGKLTKGLALPMNLLSESVTRHKLVVDKLIASCYDEGFYQGVEQQ